MASSLLEELKTVATEVKRNQIEDAVGSSWATLAVKDYSQLEWDRDSIGPNGSRRRKRAGRGTGKTGAGGRGGAGVLNSKNNGRIRWQPSLIGRMS